MYHLLLTFKVSAFCSKVCFRVLCDPSDKQLLIFITGLGCSIGWCGALRGTNREEL